MALLTSDALDVGYGAPEHFDVAEGFLDGLKPCRLDDGD
jgi:hypothetical protein